jgi:hypothetical protein
LDDGGCSISGYTIQKDDGASGSFTVISSSIGPSVFSYPVSSGLTVGLTYRFQVIATNAVGSTTGNTVSSIVATTPDPPTIAPYVDSTETNTT